MLLQSTIQDLPEAIRNWLYNVIQPLYVHKQTVYTHVYQFLQVYIRHLFKIRTSVYTSSESGASQLLLQISGDLNVGNGTVVPIEIWIPFKYPYGEVPIVHVKQQNGSHIKPGNHIDSQGKFYHPYLVSWFQQCLQSDPSSITRYNILALANVLIETFLREYPLIQLLLPFGFADNTQSAPPPLPQKPIKTTPEAQGPQNGNKLSPTLTGPPLPSKVLVGNRQELSNTHNNNASISNVPLRYQNPLPLPNVQQQNLNGSTPQNPISPNHTSYYHGSQTLPQHYLPTYRLPQQYQNIQPQESPVHQSEQSFQQEIPQSPFRKSFQFTPEVQLRQPQPEHPIEVKPIQLPAASASYMEPKDLIDDVDLALPDSHHTQKNSTQHSSQYDKAMANIEDNVNLFLQNEFDKKFVLKINQNGMKVNALYEQLSFYYKQAQANSDKLKGHEEYLTSQVDKISQLNVHLVELEKKQQPDKIFVSDTSSFDLDELAMPDLALVAQLYNAVADIRATKDAINVISGAFPSEPELINDSNLDACVKTVRGLGRDLFWQELTKNHIAAAMGLISD